MPLLLLIMLFCVLLDVLDQASVHIEFTSVSGRWWRFKSGNEISDGVVVLDCKSIVLEEPWFIALTKRIFFRIIERSWAST